MRTLSKAVRTSVAAMLLLTGVATVVQGQVPGGGLTFGGSGRGMTLIKGNVVCAECSLDETRKTALEPQKLYQFSHHQGQVVMKVTAVNGSTIFDKLDPASQLWVRGADRFLQQLGAEENLFKEMTITGLLRTSRTLDIFEVTIHG